VPSRSVPRSSLWSIFAALMTALGLLFAFRSRRSRSEVAEKPQPHVPGGAA
jgi:hypothetical protein